MPEVPCLAEISHELLRKCSVVPEKTITLAGIGSIALQQLILPSSLTVKFRVKTDQWTACFIFLLTKNPTKGKSSVTSLG